MSGFCGVREMKTGLRSSLFCVSIILAVVAVTGCDESGKDRSSSARSGVEQSRAKMAGATIGSLANVFSPGFIPVRGYSLVGELDGTGSSECPASIRPYLRQYILKQIPDRSAERLINSRDTAVVAVEGLLPTSRGENEYFDVRVTALGGTRTTSLEGGQLYGAELREAGTLGFSSKVIAEVEGPVYIDKLEGPASEKRSGYVLGGARILDEYRIILVLREPDYLVASAIRNKLIENFGDGVARAVSDNEIELHVPRRYKGQKGRFISIVRATYLGLTAERAREAISQAVAVLGGSGGDKGSAEVTLEAIGQAALDELEELLGSSDGEVRLRAGRSMLNLGSDAGLDALREIALDKDSGYRLEALEAITNAARYNDAASICRRLLRDESLEVRLQAYEQLRKLEDVAITSEVVGGSFFLEQIAGTPYKTIFVSRQGRPRTAIFGGPIYCGRDVFIQSWDGDITINAQQDKDYVMVIRRVPHKPGIPPVALKSTHELSSIIRTLGSEPKRRQQGGSLGLAVSYADIIALLRQMVEKGAVDVEFRAGPMPKINFK